jgi:transcription elongation factor Elf1
VYRYIIVICPSCGEIQAVESRFKTKSCSRCGHRFEISKAKMIAGFNNAYEVTRYTIKLKELKYKGSN